MEKWTHSLSRQLDRLQSRFESLLETEGGKADPDAPPFEASRDPGLVEGISLGLPDDHVDRAVILFSRLALLFDAGILLENQDGRWKAQALFHEGTARPLRRNIKESIALPGMSSVSALRTESAPLIRKLGLDPKTAPGFSSAAYLVRPVPDFAFVLSSSLPDLWLKDHLERTVLALARGFSE